jgi:hypothetical protein
MAWSKFWVVNCQHFHMAKVQVLKSLRQVQRFAVRVTTRIPPALIVEPDRLDHQRLRGGTAPVCLHYTGPSCVDSKLRDAQNGLWTIRDPGALPLCGA